MIKGRSYWCCLAISSLFFFLILPSALFAGTTGKIRGIVKDAKTNEVLPGVNIILSHIWREETAAPFGTIGAASDKNGQYIILKIPPGIYSLEATMMGYKKNIHQKVRVSVDRTSSVDFLLVEDVLDLKAEIVVQAKRDIVQLDVSSTENYITQKDYQDTPFANRIEDMLGMQSGVTGNIIEGEMEIRGGDAREIGLMMDGMLMVDKKFNRPVITINPGIVQEIKVMRNGFNAEYGQSRSGMINVVTKDPGSKYSFNIDYQFEPPQKRHSGRSIYDTNNLWYWKLLTGENAMTGGDIFINEGHGYTQHWDGWNKVSEDLLNDNNPNNDLTPEEAFELWKWRHRPIDYGNRSGHNLDLSFLGPMPFAPFQTGFLTGFKVEYHPFTFPQSREYYEEKVSSLKLVSKISSNIKLNLSGLYSETNTVTQGNSTSEWSGEDRLSYDGGGSEIYYPFRKPVIDRYTTVLGAKLVHTLSARSFYEINVNYWFVRWGVGRGKSALPEDGRYFHGRLYLDPHSGWINPTDGLNDLGKPSYKMSGGAFTWDDAYNRRTVINAIYLNQFHWAHELKTGFEFSYDRVHQNRVFWLEENPNRVFTRKYDGNPIEIAAFIQDKIEFKGMIANIGLRFDYYHTNTEQYNIHRVLDHDENDKIMWSDTSLYRAVIAGTFPQYQAKPRYYFSPRLGISHPLTERSKIYFNFGHFVQSPPTQAVFQLAIDNGSRSIQGMGNGEMKFQTTIVFELGYDHNISDFFQLHIGAYYKDYHDVASGMVYAHHPTKSPLIIQSVGQRENREIRGIEVELRKSYGRWVTGWLNYNISKKSVSDLSAPGSDIPIITDEPSIGINGEIRGIPRQDVKDVVPNGQGVIKFLIPNSSGPKWKGGSILGGTSLSLQVFYQAGRHLEHPKKQFRLDHPDVKFFEIDKYWANMRLARLFNVKSILFEFYIDVSNLLHSKFRELPILEQNRIKYFDDLFNAGRMDQLGTDKLTDSAILNTESDNVYWGKYKQIIVGLRFNL